MDDYQCSLLVHSILTPLFSAQHSLNAEGTHRNVRAKRSRGITDGIAERSWHTACSRRHELRPPRTVDRSPRNKTHVPGFAALFILCTGRRVRQHTYRTRTISIFVGIVWTVGFKVISQYREGAIFQHFSVRLPFAVCKKPNIRCK